MSSLLILLSFMLVSSSLYAQNKRAKNTSVGYMGKRYLLNAYSNINFIPFGDYYLPYNTGTKGFLSSIKIPAAWSLEGEYIINRRFGVTLGSTSFRASAFDPEQSDRDNMTKVRTNSISIGVKNYLKREGGLAPVGFYQQLRVQRLMGDREDFVRVGEDYVSSNNKTSIETTTLLGYGVGFNFGMGKIPLFTVGADFMTPMGASSAVQYAFGSMFFTARLGVVVPLF